METRPETFSGAIGRFTLDAELVPRTAKVGDPLTLTVTLQGKGTLDRSQAPDLTAVPEVTDQFKVYQATEETRDDTRKFTYSLRPKRAGITEFPPIELSYFDTDREEFVALRTDAMPMEISAAERLPSGEISVATAGGGIGRFEAAQEGVFANITSLDELRDERVHPDTWIISMIAMAGGFMFLVFARRRAERGETSQTRRRQAVSRVRKEITRLRSSCAELPRRDVADRLGDLLTSLVAEVHDQPPSGFTSTEAVECLHRSGVESSLVNRYESLLETCDTVRYGGGAESLTDSFDDAEMLVGQLAQELRSK